MIIAQVLSLEISHPVAINCCLGPKLRILLLLFTGTLNPKVRDKMFKRLGRKLKHITSSLLL